MNPELNNDYYDLIIRQLDGSISQEDDTRLNLWLKDQPGNQQVYDSIKALWAGAAEASIFEQIDIDADWALVKNMTEKPVNVKAQKKTAKIRPMRWAAGIAAGLALILLSYFAYLNLNPEQGIREIALSDGSKVWLNENAEFNYPKSFSGAERTVTLSGEAFFEIAKNAEIPFVIMTPESKVTVLGTSFNVKTDEATTEVIVATGKVELSDFDDPGKSVILTKGLKGVHQGENLVSIENDNQNYLAWKTRIFNFDGVPIAFALQQISAVSSKPVRLESGLSSDCQLRANFEKEDIPAMLETIALSCGLSVKAYENAYVLSAPKE